MNCKTPACTVVDKKVSLCGEQLVAEPRDDLSLSSAPSSPSRSRRDRTATQYVMARTSDREDEYQGQSSPRWRARVLPRGHELRHPVIPDSWASPKVNSL